MRSTKGKIEIVYECNVCHLRILQYEGKEAVCWKCHGKNLKEISRAPRDDRP